MQPPAPEVGRVLDEIDEYLFPSGWRYYLCLKSTKQKLFSLPEGNETVWPSKILPSLFSEALIPSISWNTITLLIDPKHFVEKKRKEAGGELPAQIGCSFPVVLLVVSSVLQTDLTEG